MSGRHRTRSDRSIDKLKWTEQHPTRLDCIDNAGSPGMAAIGSFEDTVVFLIDNRMVEGQTAIVVGKVQHASGWSARDWPFRNSNGKPSGAPLVTTRSGGPRLRTYPASC